MIGYIKRWQFFKYTMKCCYKVIGGSGEREVLGGDVFNLYSMGKSREGGKQEGDCVCGRQRLEAARQTEPAQAHRGGSPLLPALPGCKPSLNLYLQISHKHKSLNWPTGGAPLMDLALKLIAVIWPAHQVGKIETSCKSGISRFIFLLQYMHSQMLVLIGFIYTGKKYNIRHLEFCWNKIHSRT